MRDLISLLPAIVLLVIEVPSVHPLYVDMYGKLVQVDTLDDCTVYVYDRVVDMQGPEAWCKSHKGNVDIGFDDEMVHPYIFGVFYDEEIFGSLRDNTLDVKDTLSLLIYKSNGTFERQKLFPRLYFEPERGGDFENVNRKQHIEYDKPYYGYQTLEQSDLRTYYNFTYYLCEGQDYDHINNVFYNRTGEYVNTSVLLGGCLPRFLHSVNGTTIEIRILQEVISPYRTFYNCSVGDWNFLTRILTISKDTVFFKYNMFKNLSESFPPELYITKTPIPNGYFNGVIKENGKLFGPWGQPLKRPPIERNYTEVPFFFVSNNGSSYSPLFLYYKYVGPKLDFAVRFYYNNNPDFRIIGAFKYSTPCGFDDDNVTVVAAPRVLKQNKTSIALEVLFYQSNNDFKSCAFETTYNYETFEHSLRKMPTSDIVAYVHVETRSKIAVNCQYENRTVHWLLAYTEKQEAELISLDNDVSSPIFPCPLCGPDTVMYCDVNPKTAETYDSAVFLVNGNEIRFIGVKKSMKYIKRIEYYITKTPDELYFAQLMDLSLFVDGSYKKPQTTESPLKHLTTESPPELQTTESPPELQTTESPPELQTTKSPSGVDPVAGTPDTSNTDASSNGALGLRYLWITLLSFVILTYSFLTELM